MLIREEDNDRNSDATVGFIDGKKVCYVANDECHDSSLYLQNSPFGVLEGVVSKVDTANKRCKADFYVDENVKITPPNEDYAFQEWEERYKDIPLMRTDAVEQRLTMLQRHIEMTLANGATFNKALKDEFDDYIGITRLDISREATQSRRRIANLMLQSHDQKIRSLGEKLELIITKMGGDTTCAALVRYIARELPARKPFDDMTKRNSNFNQLRLEEAMAAFPYHLYDEYHISQPGFVSRLYYRKIPGRILRRFLSGLLLLEWLKNHISATCQQAEITNRVQNFVSSISSYATEPWKDRVGNLWRAITNKYYERMAQTGRAKDTSFNARLVCSIVGHLITIGVYDRQTSQTHYAQLLKLNGKDMRTNINKGLADHNDVKKFVNNLVGHHPDDPFKPKHS